MVIEIFQKNETHKFSGTCNDFIWNCIFQLFGQLQNNQSMKSPQPLEKYTENPQSNELNAKLMIPGSRNLI